MVWCDGDVVFFFYFFFSVSSVAGILSGAVRLEQVGARKSPLYQLMVVYIFSSVMSKLKIGVLRSSDLYGARP